METLGLVLFASLFVVMGVKHIRNHDAMAGYTTSVMGACPLGVQLGYFGGWPTGVFLTAAGTAAGLGEAWGFYALAGFLAVATALFHRDFYKDPAGFKGVALAGAALAIGSLVA